MTERSEPTPPEGGLASLWAAPRTAHVLLFVAPVMFNANMLTARATADFIPPVALAFWRWAVVFLILLAFVGPRLWVRRHAIAREWKDLLALGALGMGACGAFVYIGADTTTATNIGLIYAASPVLIVVLARLAYGEPLSLRQAVGTLVALAGVVVIVAQGELSVLAGLRFTPGDLWIVGATAAWAVYAVLLRYRPSEMGPMTRFGAIVMFGVLVLLPFHLWELAAGAVPVPDGRTITAVLTVAVIAGFGAYQVYGRVQETLGAAKAGLILYLSPVFNSLLAFLLLGEQLRAFHFAGAVLILTGIYLATARQPKTKS